YVCGTCKHKYTDCSFIQLKYDPIFAQKKYEAKLHNSRKGINLTKEEYDQLVTTIKEGLKTKRSIYASIKASKVDVSLPTVYRYISEKKVPISKMDLPYAVTYKKRKKKIKEYDYSNNKIDRSNRTYLDYLAYIKTRINEITTQMDFLGSIKSDSKSILVLILPQIHFIFLFIIEKRNSLKVVDTFNSIESLIGYEKFCEIFPSILTDRDPSFSDIHGIEFSKELGAQRTFLFFCDAFKSNQKASVENMNEQIRKFFPKGKSIDNYNQEQINLIAKTINETPLFSLDGYSPKEGFILLFGLETYIKLFGE
ncbi:MAG: IS30 family transposase, partial [Candidatus Onthovivens sp.]|nr:IS30 family transposase [Candidatus Onthovivens sp.]